MRKLLLRGWLPLPETGVEVIGGFFFFCTDRENRSCRAQFSKMVKLWKCTFLGLLTLLNSFENLDWIVLQAKRKKKKGPRLTIKLCFNRNYRNLKSFILRLHFCIILKMYSLVCTEYVEIKRIINRQVKSHNNSEMRHVHHNQWAYAAWSEKTFN